ncbi:MAG: four helix bundle protein [Bacteroidales bacterium]|nr:four helix bundle protein [Bacteroidales bacterium]
MKDNVITEKSKSFSLKIINIYKSLCEDKREFVLSKQLLRSGTSIGANITEANYAQSEADFLSKMHISLKEAAETSYWLDLLYQSNYIDKKDYDSLYPDCIEIIKILTSITKSLKDKLQQSKNK